MSRIKAMVVFILAIFAFSCNQDSIFHDISNEPEPKTALIPGSPTNMAVLKNQLYVGSRMGSRIFCFSNMNGTLGWSVITLPEGSLGELATDGSYLYALVFPGGNPMNFSIIKRYDVTTKIWGKDFIIEDYSIQTLFGAGGTIFAGARKKSDSQNYEIIYLDVSSNSHVIIKYGTSLLTGAARDNSGNIYLSTAGSGVFLYSGNSLGASAVSGTEDENIQGIISAGNTIIAVGNSNVFSSSGGTSFNSFQTGFTFTGAMCVWRDRNNSFSPSLLLMGIRGKSSSIVHGYREMILSNSAGDIFTIKNPGDDSPTSVINRAKYNASIGTHPIESILQVPDISEGGPIDYSAFSGNSEWEPLIFACTSKSGLWSYRNGEWNAEE